MIVLPFDIRRVYKGLILVNIFSFRKAEKVIGVGMEIPAQEAPLGWIFFLMMRMG